MPGPCYATYPGVTAAHVVGFSGTESVDNQPGRFTLTLSQAATPAPTGTLVFTDGIRTVTIPGCRATSARPSPGGQFQITLEDRRWRWETGAVFGHYNRPFLSFVLEQKTPRELAELLWDEMNETDLDVRLLPNDARPEVNWYAANPAEELIALLGSLGCVLAPQLDGRWKVYPVGAGDLYAPPAGSRIAVDSSQEFEAYPDSISVVTAPIQYEVVFALEAVGEETDGQIKPIDELSYTPAHGWNKESSYFGGLGGLTYERDGRTLNTQDLARSCIRKWYRVASMPAGTGEASLNPPGYPTSLPHVLGLYSLLPLVPVINEIDYDSGSPSFGERKPADCWGRFKKDDMTGLVSREGTKVPFPFSLDAKSGIVRFSEEVTTHPGDFSTIDPAELLLRCVVEVKDDETNAPVGYQRTITTGLANGTGAEVILRDELELRWTPQWATDGTTEPLPEGGTHRSNQIEIDREADYYLAAKLAGYAPQQSGTLALTGIHAPNLNGLQTNVTWTFGATQPPVTTIGIGTRANPYLPKFKDRQQWWISKSQRLKQQRRQRLEARGLFRGQP